MLSVETVETFEAFQSLETAWNGLLAESDLDIPLMRHEWFSCCWRSLGEKTKMLVLLVKENGRLIGIAPCMLKKESFRGLPATSIIFIGETHYFRTGLIFSGNGTKVIEAILEYLKASPFGYDVLTLDLIEKDGATGRALREVMHRRRMKHVEIPSDSSPYIRVTGTWEEYFKGRSKNFKHKINRISNLFERRGGWEIVRYTTNGIDQALDEVFAISQKTWKFRNRSAITSDPENTRFYRTLAHTAAARGWLNLWMLRVGGVPAAFAYNLAYKNRIYALQIEYNEDFAAMSPSEFLNTRAIRECFSNGMTEYDWLGKDLPFKMKWTSQKRDHAKYIIFNDTAYASLLYFWKNTVIGQIQHLIKRAPVSSPPAS